MSETIEKEISICNIMKENTSNLIQKMEEQIPIYGQIYSDMYKESLHMIDDLFGTCYISEKELFDKLNINEYTLQQWNKFWKSVIDEYSTQIDMSTKYLKSYSEMRTSMIQAYEKYMHSVMDHYAKSFTWFNCK